jgi:lipoteichoic acid synthase
MEREQQSYQSEQNSIPEREEADTKEKISEREQKDVMKQPNAQDQPNTSGNENIDKAKDIDKAQDIDKAKDIGKVETIEKIENDNKTENDDKTESTDGIEKIDKAECPDKARKDMPDAKLPVPTENATAQGGWISGISQNIRGKLNKIGNKFTDRKDLASGNKKVEQNVQSDSKWYPVLYFIGLIVYLEAVLHLLIFRSFDVKIIYPVLFAVPFAIILAFITGLFPVRLGKIFMWVSTVLVCIVFQVQLVYYYVFKVFFSFQLLGMAGDAVSEFSADILTAIKENIGGILLLLLPLVLLGFLMKRRVNYGKRGLKEQGILLGGGVLFQLLALLALLCFGRSDYSPYDLYFKSHIPDLCGEQLGITTMTRFDISKLLFEREELTLAQTMNVYESEPELVPSPLPTPAAEPNSETAPTAMPDATPTPTPLPTPTPIDTSPNVMEIDFQALAEKEKSKTIKTLHNYFASVTPTNKNEYTGRFKGYNLIMITAEGFSPYAINEETTPTLYRLVREGFVFNNFYTPLWQTSTSDGEYVAMTGLIPQGTRSMYRGRKNLWPFSLGRQFNQLGVESKAYHNHTYTYYQRNETHTNLGYRWKAVGNGLELPSNGWPRSDLEMMEATVAEYVEEEQFHVYYLTVSGHMNYTFAGNSMAARNRDLVRDLPYSEDAKAYLACQLELDRALELLIAKLEEAGVAEKTVIALSADHYPYGWEKYKLDELAGHEVDPDFEIFKNHFILWSEGMKEKVEIDEPCSSLDILPTLSNLFGLEYDSRLLMGQDIFSDAEPLVMLSNRSFITDKAMYNSATGEVTQLTEEPLLKDYISNLNKVVKNKFSVSKSILEEDYYDYVFPEKEAKK